MLPFDLIKKMILVLNQLSMIGFLIVVSIPKIPKKSSRAKTEMTESLEHNTVTVSWTADTISVLTILPW